MPEFWVWKLSESGPAEIARKVGNLPEFWVWKLPEIKASFFAAALKKQGIFSCYCNSQPNWELPRRCLIRSKTADRSGHEATRTLYRALEYVMRNSRRGSRYKFIPSPSTYNKANRDGLSPHHRAAVRYTVHGTASRYGPGLS